MGVVQAPDSMTTPRHLPTSPSGQVPVLQTPRTNEHAPHSAPINPIPHHPTQHSTQQHAVLAAQVNNSVEMGMARVRHPTHPGGNPMIRFPVPGDVLTSARGQYLVGEKVGQGAYGAVYEAIGPFDQRFALKLLIPANRPYAEVYSEWSKEAQRLLQIRHPGIVYMHDAFEWGNLLYLSLEWCSHSLRDMLAEPVVPGLVVEIARQLLAAVQYLHDNDIVHTDLHPGNVLLTLSERPVVKLADFGISQELKGQPVARPAVVHHAIMAPEVVASGYTSRQSDIYQVGLLLYWMLIGTPALDYNVAYPELVKQVSDGVPRRRAEAIGTPLGNVIAKMLRRREVYRYASAHEVWRDLREVPDRHMIHFQK
jgi:eukaryotic-like serine/threonine-protein kinase